MPLGNNAFREVRDVEFVRPILQGIFGFQPVVVNPTNAEFEAAFGHKRFDTEPEYIKTINTPDGKTAKRIRVDVCGYVHAANKEKEEYTLSFYITNLPRKSQAGKFQYIDEFGNTAWSTDIKTEVITTSFDKNFCRKSFDGEEQLISAIIAANNIKPQQKLVDGTWVKNPNVVDIEECKVFFSSEELSEIFEKGDLSSIKKMFELPIQYKINFKILLGTRAYVNSEGKPETARTFYKSKFLRPGANMETAISAFSKALLKYKADSETYVTCPGVILHPDKEEQEQAVTSVDVEEIPSLDNTESEEELPF